MSPTIHFTVFVLVSFAAFVGLLHVALRRRPLLPSRAAVLGVAAIVVVGGMLFAKAGQNAGLPWWVYYTVPALVTWLLPPIAFRMHRGEAAVYLVLAALSAPTIHVAFSLLLGWKEYMPFLAVPSLGELLL